jgi:hypothetical protein
MQGAHSVIYYTIAMTIIIICKGRIAVVMEIFMGRTRGYAQLDYRNSLDQAFSTWVPRDIARGSARDRDWKKK